MKGGLSWVHALLLHVCLVSPAYVHGEHLTSWTAHRGGDSDSGAQFAALCGEAVTRGSTSLTTYTNRDRLVACNDRLSTLNVGSRTFTVPLHSTSLS